MIPKSYQFLQIKGSEIRGREEALCAIFLTHHYVGLVATDGEETTEWQVFFPHDTDTLSLQACVTKCLALLPPGTTAAVRQLPMQDWTNQWKAFFHPIEIAPGIVVTAEGPSTASGSRQTLILTPGMAFGTGQHPTTQLVARAIATDYPHRHWPQLLDIGTGSGILAMIAVASGVASVDATDIDPDALIVARENIVKNGMGDTITLHPSLEALTGPYPAIAANILLAPLCTMAPAIVARLAPGGDCYLSGVLQEQVEPLSQAYLAVGCTLVRTETLGEWALAHCRKK